MRAYNFSAGPAMLPTAVMEQAQAEFLEYPNEYASVMEISHRGDAFLSILSAAESDVRELLQLPNNYHVLFLPGGASAQFFAVPMNLCGKQTKVAYANTGLWSQKAMQEAKRYADVVEVTQLQETDYVSIPASHTWTQVNDAAYLHYTDNETVSGIEFNFIPQASHVTLVSDMSSNIFSRVFDVTQFGLIYAGAQKNSGPAGFALVIVRDDLIGQALKITPSLFDYALQVKAHSSLNTPPTYNIYLAALCFRWLKQQGGVAAIEKINARKAQKLYAVIDRYPELYRNRIDVSCRSRMNVTFALPNDTLHARFLQQSAALGLINLEGHRTYGGMRASLYNAMPEAGVDLLVSFMKDFASAV